MEIEFSLRPFLVGILTGAICVGGLVAGLRIVLKTLAAGELPKFRKNLNFLSAALLLAGQLIVALLVLFKTGAGQENPLFFGFGLVASMLGFSLLSKLIYNA